MKCAVYLSKDPNCRINENCDVDDSICQKMSVFNQPVSQHESTICCQEKNYYQDGDVIWVCGHRICMPPHVRGFPTEVIEKEVQGNPTKEKYLIDIVSEERLIIVLGPARSKLL